MTGAPTLQQVDRTYVREGNRRLSYFAGCDYYRLASHPRILKAVGQGLKRYGLNVAASRLTTGNHELYELLERRLAGFFDVESATLAGGGYAPNLMVAQALAGQFSHVLIDERAHGSLVDAAQLLDCPVLKFQHCDAADLARILRRLGRIKPLALTDGVFAHDGTVAPIQDYLAVLPANALLLLDDAHGAGILGGNGRGTPEHAGVDRKRIIQTVTLSKAFGVYGGAVLASREIRSAILARSRLFRGATPLPLPLANAALQAVTILETDTGLRSRLARNIRFVNDGLRAHGFPINGTPTPILSLIPRDFRESARIKRELRAAGIHPPFIQYPGGPGGGYFRIVISSEHTQRQLDQLLSALLSGVGAK